jgi:DNA-binding NarL/FixJ family response regulator
MDSPVIRVVLADSHRAVRQGLRDRLTAAEGIRVVAETERCGQVGDAVRQYRPDVLALNVQLADGSGIEAIRRLRMSGSDVGILALVTFESASYIKAAIEAGANGYVLKFAEAAEIVEAVRAVHEANRVLIQVKLGRGDS